LKLHNTLSDDDIIVNIQGDEPLIDSHHIDQAVEQLRSESKDVVMSTLVTPIVKESNAVNPNIVKCVFDKNNIAMYFSRAMIPNNK
jgi:3-deoxy-manno-octulosonate cytidylyltransferase (CMP-KDO synthetase)